MKLFILILFLSSICMGYTFKLPIVRIMGGSRADIKDYPYQVSVMRMGNHFCGGSLIHPQYVLTAAHCVEGYSAENFNVRAGSSMRDKDGDVKKVIEIHSHPQYNKDNLDNDVCILKVESPFDLSEKVKIIDLPSQDNPIEDHKNQVAVATGWGRLFNNGPLSSKLQKVDLPILSQEICNQVYEEQVTSRMFCAGYLEGGKDTCQGDSGGPLVMNGVQLGITSWGDNCGEECSPGVYVVVSNFIDFIEATVPTHI